MTENRNYHHGNLREALLAAARETLASAGHEALSLRGIARDIGVASSAPYAHFPSRDALLWALVEGGAGELRKRFEVAAATPLPATQRLAALCRAYLDYAGERPELFRLMLASPLTTERIAVPDAESGLRLLEAIVGDVMDSHDQDAVRYTAIGCLSAIHGFAMLRLHNRLAPGIDIARAVEAVIAAAVRQASHV